jgi:hypothetical protein
VKSEHANLTEDDCPIEIYDRGEHIVTMSAQYEIGDIETAYSQALDEMKSAGYYYPVRNSGNQIDRSRLDIAVVHFLRRQGLPRKSIETVLLRGSEKALERGENYVEKTLDAVFIPR